MARSGPTEPTNHTSQLRHDIPASLTFECSDSHLAEFQCGLVTQSRDNFLKRSGAHWHEYRRLKQDVSDLSGTLEALYCKLMIIVS